MPTFKTPDSIKIVAKISDDPHFRGSIHDDSSAQVYGYRSALVPGPIVYGYLAQLARQTFGVPWLEFGTMSSNSRRPAFHGDVLTISAEPIVETGDNASMVLHAYNADGQHIASGAATLSRKRPEPFDPSDYPTSPVMDESPFVDAGGMIPGVRFFSNPIEVTPAVLDEHLAEFSETWPGYREEGIVPSGYLMRRMVRDTVLSYRHPTPGIFVSADNQHLALARVGDVLVTVGVVTREYEKKGNRYFDSTHVVIANGRKPIAISKRSTVYVARAAKAA